MLTNNSATPQPRHSIPRGEHPALLFARHFFCPRPKAPGTVFKRRLAPAAMVLACSAENACKRSERTSDPPGTAVLANGLRRVAMAHVQPDASEVEERNDWPPIEFPMLTREATSPFPDTSIFGSTKDSEDALLFRLAEHPSSGFASLPIQNGSDSLTARGNWFVAQSRNRGKTITVNSSHRATEANTWPGCALRSIPWAANPRSTTGAVAA